MLFRSHQGDTEEDQPQAPGEAGLQKPQRVFFREMGATKMGGIDTTRTKLTNHSQALVNNSFCF